MGTFFRGGRSGLADRKQGGKILNNILYNRSGFSLGDQHVAIYAPREPTAGGIPSPQRTDVDLKIRRSLIWSGVALIHSVSRGADRGVNPRPQSVTRTNCAQITLSILLSLPCVRPLKEIFDLC